MSMKCSYIYLLFFVWAYPAKRLERIARPQGAERSLTADSKAINHKAINVTPWDGYATAYNVYEPLIYPRTGTLFAARCRPSFRSSIPRRAKIDPRARSWRPWLHLDREWRSDSSFFWLVFIVIFRVTFETFFRNASKMKQSRDQKGKSLSTRTLLKILRKQKNIRR